MADSNEENDLISYKVVRAETVSSVAARHGTTPQRIARLNRIASPYVFPGQTIIIPREDQIGETPKKHPEVDIVFESGARHITSLGFAGGHLIVTAESLYFDAHLGESGQLGVQMFRIEQPISQLVSLSTFSHIPDFIECPNLEPSESQVLYFRMKFIPTEHSRADEFWLEVPINTAFDFQKYLLLSSSIPAILPSEGEKDFKKVGPPEPDEHFDYFYKEVIHFSEFDRTLIDKIFQYVPARVCCEDWQVVYSTQVDGYSLQRLIRAYREVQNSSLMIIRDSQRKVFGVYLSHPLRLGKSFFGTGETYLFSFHPKFNIYRWSGDNNYFIKCNVDGLIFGASEGHYGLWIDEELCRGTSSSCSTFDNHCLTATSDFVINNIEVWSYSQGCT